MYNLFLVSLEVNTDILETNIINIVILVSVLFNFVGSALKGSLLKRKEVILIGLQEADRGLEKANERVLEVQTKISQSTLILDKIEDDKVQEQENLAVNRCDSTSEQFSRDVRAVKLSIEYKEQQALSEVKEIVTTLALDEVINDIKSNWKSDIQKHLVNTGIKSLAQKALHDERDPIKKTMYRDVIRDCFDGFSYPEVKMGR